MTQNFRRIACAALAAAALGGPLSAQNSGQRRVPDNIQVPPGHVAFLNAQASGTQNYICAPSESGFGWRFFGPQATLFVSFKWMYGDAWRQVTTHFLSPNPAENGMPRATWLSSFDSSAVWARAVAQSTDPAFVAEGAIPWLLLEIVGARQGPMGGGVLTLAKYIQRVNTSGGVAPSTGCSQETNGATVLVPYTTEYVFYRSAGNN